MAASRKSSVQPREKTKCICTAQPEKEMAPLREVKTASVLGAGRGEPDLQEGEVAEEKVYGRLQAPVCPDQREDGQVPGHREHVREQEELHVEAPGPGKPSKMNGPPADRFWLRPQAMTPIRTQAP